MAKMLKDLAWRDLNFVDERPCQVPGTVSYLEGFGDSFPDGGKTNYFFIPYDTKHTPFRISVNGSSKIRISEDHKDIHGCSSNYRRTAKIKELDLLSDMECIARLVSSFSGLTDKLGPCVISFPEDKNFDIKKMKVPKWVSGLQ